MSRPSQLLLVGLVYCLGATIAAANGAPPDRPALLAGALALLPTAASVHYANEFADHQTDALTVGTPFSGGSGALAETGLPRTLALRAAVVTLLAGALATGACVAWGPLPPPAAALLLAIAVLGWQYSVGPLRLAWRGLGELDNALLGGLLLPVYGAAALSGPLRTTALACLPFAFLVFANLLATQWPDREADGAVGKRTLATRLSAGSIRRLSTVVVASAYGSLLALWGSVLPTPVVGASLLVVPLSAWGLLTVTRRRVPLPPVAAMVALCLVQLLAWGALAVEAV
jgi:1,4-dihydroxy-2-naphthoate octaprenyltransferase